MESYQKPTCKSTHVWTCDFDLKKSQKHIMKESTEQMVLMYLMSALNMQIDSYLPPTVHETQVQVDQRPQYKTRHSEPDRKKTEDNLELTGTVNTFLNRTMIALTRICILSK